MSREEGQILYCGTLRMAVDRKDFSGVLTNYMPEPTVWRVQIFNLSGSLMKEYKLRFLPSLLNTITVGSAIYTRVR